MCKVEEVTQVQQGQDIAETLIKVALNIIQSNIQLQHDLFSDVLGGGEGLYWRGNSSPTRSV